MNRILTLALVAVSACTALAQTAREEIAANRFLAGSNYLDYDKAYGRDPLTPAPKGYEPYYLSHYGRHGSRWLLGDGDYSGPMRTLKKAEAQGKLTAAGAETLAKLERFYPSSINRLGDLTTVGERQHHGIGRRMARNFPEIFKKNGVAIDARSTVVIRCILSMTAECEELAAANPTARIHNDVSESLQYYLNQPWQGVVRKQGGKGWKLARAYRERYTHPERLAAALFNDPQWARDSIDTGSFMRHLFEVAANMQSHDTDIDLLSLFTDEECYDQWRIRNIDWYLNYGAAPATEGVMPFSQKNLLRNIIESADTVTQVQAALRFGHEVCVMPLVCLLELGNNGARVENLDTLDRQWRNYEIYPMGCNVQLVFYRPKRGRTGDILVKALLNECEVSLPVATTTHPYYKWADVRQYYLEKIRNFEAIDQ